MLKTKIKASSITNLTDARYFAAWGVHWLGFDFKEGSETNISARDMKAISDWVDGVEIVGEFEIHTSEEIQQAIELLNLDAVQVGMLTTTETLIELNTTISVIKEIVVAKESTEDDIIDHLSTYAPYCQLFLLDFEKNGISWSDVESGTVLSMATLRKICTDYSVLLNIDLSEKVIDPILTNIAPAGLCLKGGQEEKVGFKSFEELDEILEALEDLE